MKKGIEKLKKLAPVISVAVVLGCTVVSLQGYETPVYATEKTDDTESVKEKQKTPDDNEETAKGSFDLEDGVYQGVGTGFSGDVTVAVQIKDKQIVAIDILSTSDDEAFFNRAMAVIDKIIKQQSLEVDVVSGATYSSNGIINAVKNALTGEKDSGKTGASSTGGSATGASKSIEAVADASAYKDGTYIGNGTGFGGALRVQVTISGGKISNIQILEHNEGSSYLQKASAIMNAIISAQSTNVDTVSGATYSSVGIIQAVRDALAQAAVIPSDDNSNNQEDKSETNDSNERVMGTVPYVEGIYYGTAEGYLGDITVAVVIQDQTIKAILVTDTSDDETFFNRAMDVVKNVVKNQNTQVDTVSGATYSSNGLLNAIKNALDKAEKATNGENITETVDTTILQNLISHAQQLIEKDYTSESWKNLQTKLEQAETAIVSNSQEDIQAATSDLDTAIKELQLSNEEDDNQESSTMYQDGTYSGSAICVPDEDEDFRAYNLSLKITIRNDKIVAISDIAGDGDTSNNSYIKRAANGTSLITGVTTQIINRGTLENIDTVSRATCTSKTIVDACNNAMEKAKK